MATNSRPDSEPPPAPSRAPRDAGLLRTFSASLAVLIATLVLLYAATAGGRAFTTETLRRAEVERVPQPVPDFALTDSEGRSTTLHALLADGGRAWIVDFVYTRCQTLCTTLASDYQRLQQQIVDAGLQQHVGLLSVSFDLARDDPAALRDYAARMKAAPGLWRIVSLTSVDDRRRLLDDFGILVIPAPLGEFEHNAALHIVSPDGRLLHIADYGDPARALALAVATAAP